MAKQHKTFAVGDVVRLTGAFLRSTGQFTGSEGRKTWRVLAVTSHRGSPYVIAVDEDRDELSYWTAEELASDLLLRKRRIAACNLILANEPDLT